MIVISYAHEDADFVQQLGVNLFRHRVSVWIDRWELKVGDSLIKRIEEAITKADALIVVLSKASIESDWCKKELTAGLVRELEEKSVFVLPVVIDECKIPLFLRDKLYADFRRDKDKAFQLLLAATAKLTSDTLHREDNPAMVTDFSLSYGVAPDESELSLILTFLDMPKDQPYSVITEIIIKCNEEVAKRYVQFSKHGFDWFERTVILSMVSNAVEEQKLGFLVLQDSSPEEYTFSVADPKRNIQIEVLTRCRRLGEDTGMDIAVDWGTNLKRHVQRMMDQKEKLPLDAQRRLYQLISEI